MQHCCNIMEEYATHKNASLEYSPETRAYDLHVVEEWAEMVEKELGLKSVWDIEWNEIPDKYKTDEWWKKRGL